MVNFVPIEHWYVSIDNVSTIMLAFSSTRACMQSHKAASMAADFLATSAFGVVTLVTIRCKTEETSNFIRSASSEC